MGKQRNKWTNEEVEALKSGVKKHGVSKWQLILNDPQFASSLANRNNIDLKDKWRNLCRSCDRRDNMMRRPPSSSKKQSKKIVVKELNDSQYYHNPCTVTRQRRRIRNNRVHQGSEESVIEEFSDSEDYLNACTVTHQRSRNYIKTISQDSDSQDYNSPYTITRQRKGNHNNKVNQSRKLDSEKVHSYLENLWLNFSEDKKNSFTYLDPLWYLLYLDDSNKERVLNWIKKKDIFSRKYLVFPIVVWGHWSVLIFCHLGGSLGSTIETPCILLLDSMAKTDHSKQLEPMIRKFVLDIYRSSERTEDPRLLRKMPFLVPKVPQQRDNEECGVFALYYIKLFVENAPESFSISDKYPYFMKKDWFNFEGLDTFRKTLDSTRV